MQINIKAKNFDLTDSLREFIEEKLGKDLQKFVEGMKHDPKMFIEVERTTNHHQKGEVFHAQAQLDLPGQDPVRAEAEEEDLHTAITEVKQEMERQISHYKGKREAKFKRGARRAKRDLNISKDAEF